MYVCFSGPREPALTIGMHVESEKARAKRRIERVNLVVVVFRVDGRDAGPSLWQFVAVQSARGQELQRGLHDGQLGAIELLEQEDSSSRRGQLGWTGVLRAAARDHGQADQVGGLQQAQIQHARFDASACGELRDDLALSDARRTLEQHRASSPVRDVEDVEHARADGQREPRAIVVLSRFRLLSRHDGSPTTSGGRSAKPPPGRPAVSDHCPVNWLPERTPRYSTLWARS